MSFNKIVILLLMGLFTLTADADLMNKLRSSIDEIEKKEIKQGTKTGLEA